MITPAKAIDLVIDAYHNPPALVGPLGDHPIRIHFYDIEGVRYVVPEGSKTRKDWRDNLRAWLVLDLPHVACGLSFIPEGFYASSVSVKDQLKEAIGIRDFALVGHSRGGAQAAVLAKLLLDDGLVAKKLYVIEPARAYVFKIPDELAQIPTWGVWNGNDVVPHLPLGEQFKLDIIGRPMFDPFDNHHIEAVAAAWAEAGDTNLSSAHD